MKLRTILIILTLIALISTLPGVWFHYTSMRRMITHEADSRAVSQALIIKDYLSSFLAGSSKAVEALSADRAISDVFVSSDPGRLAAANFVLDNFSRVFGGEICFVADRDGKVITSSNRNDTTSYVGKSVTFKPYFQRALEGNVAITMPFGETMARRRIYYSSPVFEVGSVSLVGVAVIKGAVNLLERKISLPAGETWVLTDRNGIVYASSNKQFLYRVLWEGASTRNREFEAQAHLGQGPWGWIGMKPVDKWTCTDSAGNVYRYKKVFVEASPGWNIVYLTDQGALMDKFYRQLIGINIFIPLALLILVWIVVILFYRRASSELERRKLAEEKLRKQNAYMNVLNETTLGLVSRMDRSALLETIIAKVIQLSGTDHGFICLYDPEADELVMHHGTGTYKKRVGVRIRPGEGLSGKVFQTGEYLWVADYARWDGRLSDSGYDSLHSAIGFPLAFEGESIGVIGFGYLEKVKHFSKQEIDFYGRFNRLASIVLYNTRLYERLEKELVEREEAEDALRDSEKRYRDFFNDNLSGAYLSKPSGYLVDCNPAFLEIFGFTSLEEARHQSLECIYDIRTDRGRFLEQLRQKGRVSNYKERLKRVDGAPVHVIENAVGAFDDNGELIEIKGYIQDITQQKNLENQLRQALKMEAVGTLAGGIAHDFNNLLMAIEGSASLVRMDMEPAHPHYHKLENIEKHVRSGSRLTAQLLGYARKGRYEIKRLDLNALVRETAETVGRTNKQVSVKLDLDGKLHPVKADRSQMEQVLFNLFINAVDAMPDGGTLGVKTANGSEQMMTNRIYQPRPGNYVMLCVSDNGIGMDRQTRERIFDPFFTTKEMGRGTGLGLASVYGIVKGHTGYIDVDSTSGLGTTFTVCLPSSSNVGGDHDAPILEQAGAGLLKGKGTILLVDDEAVILDVGREYLKVMGYSTYTAPGGQKALEVFASRKDEIDMIILDMIMPDMGGGEVYDRLKGLDGNVKVLLSSGYSLDSKASEIIGRGCNGFIQKPFGMHELSLKIKEILDD